MKYSIAFYFDADLVISEEEERRILVNVANQVKIEVNRLKGQQVSTNVRCLFFVNRDPVINIPLDKSKPDMVN